MRLTRIALFVALGVGACGAGVYAALQSEAAPRSTLAGVAPEGALLAIESPDFAGLLKTWSSSQEEQRWLKSDLYIGFSNSRLFSRLAEAQQQFAGVAGLAPDTNFLTQVAGGRSIFAWYDIGNLEFLYITEMPAGQAAKNPLLSLKDHFEQRTVGTDTFYVHTATGSADSGGSGDPNAGSGDTRMRTVAFAVRGNYLLLATREDLVAGALALMQQPAERNVANEPWYAGTVAAAHRAPGDLRMTLNLAKIVPSPYFRSYWLPQNITETKQYSAALNDLYREKGDLREERVLLSTDPEREVATADLAPVLAYLPQHAGVYRATAQPTANMIVNELEDKIMTRGPAGYRDPHLAPVADLSTPNAGETRNFEERIDETAVVTQPRSADLAALHTLIDNAHPQAMLTFAASDPVKPEESGTVFSPIHTAIVLEASGNWEESQWKSGLMAAIAPRMTIGEAGLVWQEQHRDANRWNELHGMQDYVLAIQGRFAIVASDEATLLRLLDAAHTAKPSPQLATTIAGFDHRSERGAFLRLAALLDQTPVDKPTPNGTTPAFFGNTMASLSNTFQDLDAETFRQSTSADKVTHQTVLYQWKP